MCSIYIYMYIYIYHTCTYGSVPTLLIDMMSLFLKATWPVTESEARWTTWIWVSQTWKPWTKRIWFATWPFLSMFPGWWFGTCFIFPHIGNNHCNWLICFRWVETTNQFLFMCQCQRLDTIAHTWKVPYRSGIVQWMVSVIDHGTWWFLWYRQSGKPP